MALEEMSPKFSLAGLSQPTDFDVKGNGSACGWRLSPLFWRKEMVRKNRFIRFALLTTFTVLAVGAKAITFSNVIILSPPLSNGSSFTTSANSISFFTPNAQVGDATDPLRSGTLNIQYDATNFGGPEMTANSLTVTLASSVLGSLSSVVFTEILVELDGGGNEVGTPLGSSTHTWFAGDDPTFSDTIVFSRPVFAFRAKKSFALDAPTTQGIDLAAVTINNQSIQVVPEPATMAALGLGAMALLRRKRRN
jgi:hypothetical protein